MSINTKQGELVIVQVANNKIYFDACRQGMTKQEALDYADSLIRYANGLIDLPTGPEYIEIIEDKDTSEYTCLKPMFVHTYINIKMIEGYGRFLGYARTLDQKYSFSRHFTPDMKYVVMRKDKP
jgi:hypothetical protein